MLDQLLCSTLKCLIVLILTPSIHFTTKTAYETWPAACTLQVRVVLTHDSTLPWRYRFASLCSSILFLFFHSVTEGQEHTVLVRGRHSSDSGNCPGVSPRNHRRPVLGIILNFKKCPTMFSTFDRISVLFEETQKTKHSHNKIVLNNHFGNCMWN